MSIDLDALNQTIDSLKNLRKTLMEQAQGGIKGAFEGFLKAYPQVKTITWAQYTPYFNDGEACEFNVNDPVFSPLSPELEASSPYDFEGDDAAFYTGPRWEYEVVPNPNYDPTRHWSNKTIFQRVEGSEKYDPRTTPEMREHINKLHALLCSYEMEDAMRHAFGNHVWVKAYLKDGKVQFDVNDYDHD